MELGLTIPLQRHLGIKALPHGEEPDCRFCWDFHVIPLRGRLSLLAVHCHSRYTFVRYDLSPLDWAHLPDVFQEGLEHSLSAAGFPPKAANLLCGNHQTLFTKTPRTSGGGFPEPGLGRCDGRRTGSGRERPKPTPAESDRQRQVQPVRGL